MAMGGDVKTFRAAQYARMSTVHQRYSTSNQGDKLKEYADKRVKRSMASEYRCTIKSTRSSWFSVPSEWPSRQFESNSEPHPLDSLDLQSLAGL